MNSLKQLTPLRYPGGKAKLAPFIQDLCQINNLMKRHYAEPYAGGAGVAIGLLLSNTVDEIHINDIDEAIYYFWHSMLNDTESFLKKITDTSVTIEEWYKQKEILNNLKGYSELERGFATFFLNRTNRSGILNAGVIGGKNQSGDYKLDARFNKSNLIERIEKIALHAKKIHITNLDAIEFLKSVDKKMPKNSLIYLDPPYYVKGQGLYRNFYNHNDHVEIKNVVESLSSPWIVSYDNCIEIKDIYSDHLSKEYSLTYSAHVKGQGSEVMFYKNSLKLPKFPKNKRKKRLSSKPKTMTEEEKHQMLLDNIAEGLKEIDEGKVVEGSKIFNELLKR